MSDTTKSDDKPQLNMTELLSESSETQDPNEINDDLLFDSADIPEEPTSTQTATTGESDTNAEPTEATEESAAADGAEESADDAEKTNSFQVPIIGGDTLESAAALRNRVKLDPIITGKDADLVHYNKISKRFEPTGPDAANLLEKLGDNADIYATRVGEKIAKPLMYDPASRGMKTNTAKSVRALQSPKQIQDASPLDKIIIPSAEDRLKRIAGEDPESESQKEEKRAADEKIRQRMEEDQEDEQQNNRQTHNPFPGEQLLNKLGDGIGVALSALARMIKAVATKIMEAGQHVRDLITRDAEDKGLQQSLGAEDAREVPETADTTSERAAVGESGPEGAADDLSSRLRQAVANVHAASNGVAESFHVADEQALKSLNDGLGTHEVGAPIISSPEAFQEQLATRASTDKAKVTKAINKNRQLGERLKEDVNGVLEHPDMGLISTKDRADVLEHLHTAVGSQRKLDTLADQATRNVVDKEGISYQQHREQNVSGAQSEIREALQKAREQSQIEDLARTRVSSDQSDREQEGPRPGA